MFSTVFNRHSTDARRPRTSASSRRSRVLPRVDALEDRTVLSTYTVLNLADSGAGSLRQAILSANAHPGADTVAFKGGLHGTIGLSGASGELAITGNLTINGPGATDLTVSGNHVTRVFHIVKGSTVTISGLTIAQGRSSGRLPTAMVGGAFGGGGGILNEQGANLTLIRDTLSNNQAFGAVGFTVAGGALLNLGTATSTNCLFADNQAVGGGALDAIGGAAGGAIENFGGPAGPATLTAIDTAFTNNRALAAASTVDGTYYGVGGAVDSNGGLDSFTAANAQTATATITRCTFLDNLVSGGDGSVGNGGATDNLGEHSTMTMVDCEVRGNASVGGGGGGSQGIGGGLMNGGGAILNVVGCEITDNLAFGGDNADISAANPYAGGAYGGGIANNFNGADARGILNISNSLIAGNVAQGGAQSAGSGGIGVGGGITNSPSAIMLMTNCVVSDNSAIGGRGGPGVNIRLNPGQEVGFGFGGGIDISNNGSSATIISSRIVDNRAIGGAGGSRNTGGNGYGGGVGVAWDSILGVSASPSSLTLISSIVSGNLAAGGLGGAHADGGDGFGGGMFVSANGNATVIASTFTGNVADGGGGGAGAGGHDGSGFGGGVAYEASGVFTRDPSTVIKRNRASKLGDNIFRIP